MPSAKPLDTHVREGSFRSRRHHELLLGPAVPWPELAELQGRYAATEHELERRAIGVQFEQTARALKPEIRREPQDELDKILSAPPVRYSPDANERRAKRFAGQVLARDLHAGGLSLRGIGKRLRVAPATVGRYLAELRF